MGAYSTKEQELLDRRITDENDCWLWTGPLDTNGYGKIAYNGTATSVHRVAAILWLDYSPGASTRDGSELCVLHHCDVKICFNPDHLYIGTKQDNAFDKEERSVGVHTWNSGSKLTENDVLEILAMHDSGRYTGRYIAQKFSVSPPTVQGIIKGRYWNKLTGRKVG